MGPDDIAALQARSRLLESENAELRRQLSGSQSAPVLSETASRYQTLFNNMDEGFCVIEFLDGPHGLRP